MTEKKMRKWLKTFVMLLPVVFVVLFGVHLHRHELPESVNVEVGVELMAPENNYLYRPQTITPENVVITAASQNTGVYTFTAEGESFTLYYEPNTGTYEGRVPANIGSNSGSTVRINVPFTIVRPTNNPAYALIYLEQPVYDTYTEPLEVIAASFNNYLDMYTNNNVFNIDEFYDWSVRTFFDGDAPLYYKPIFSIMVYEFVVELLFLMFSFIAFLIRFAQKWIDGFYERRF